MEWSELLRLNDKPTIAKVNGWCFGGGMRIMGLCDLAIASDRAVFGLSEINFGIFPAGGALKVPVELLSHRDALYLALTGERLSAADAEKIRLINRAVPPDKLDSEVTALARKLIEKSPVALMLTKKVFWRDKFMQYTEAVDWELANFAVLSEMTGGEWVKEGIKQFLEGQYKPGMAAYRRPEAEGRSERSGAALQVALRARIASITSRWRSSARMSMRSSTSLKCLLMRSSMPRISSRVASPFFLAA